MANRITKKTLLARIEVLNTTFGYPLEPYTRSDSGGFITNANTYTLDCAYGGYRLAQNCNGGGERDITPRGSARETYDSINAFIYGAEAMLHRLQGNKLA